MSNNSIIGDKYRDRYKEKDWLGQLIDEVAVTQETKEVEVKDEEGNVTGLETKILKKTRLNLDDFFGLCRLNGIDTEKMEAQRENKNAPGRIRMTLGNSLRAAAKRRGGLFAAEGDWREAPQDITKGAAPVETPEGHKIVNEVAKDDESEAA